MVGFVGMLSILKRNIPAIILFVFFLSLYVYTAAPGVYDGDSGEIAAAVNELGLAHPTGFPLYMITGKLFTLLVPIKDVAYRLNLFSALLTAGSVVLLFFLLRSLNLGTTPSALASVIFGLGHNTIWPNSGTVNVYALSLFLALILINLFAKWQTTHHRKFLYWYAFIFGLSLGSHAIMVIMAIPFFLVLWQEFRLHKKIRILSNAIVLTTLPLLQYLYLWIAYVRNTVVTWGSIGSIRDFIEYITQRDYAYKISARTLDDSALFFSTLFKFLSTEFTIPFFIVMFLGFFILGKRNRLLLLFILSLITANVSIAFFYGNSEDLFILPRYLFLIYPLFTVALASFFDTLFSSASPGNREGVAFSFVVIIIFIGLQFYTGYALNNKHDHFIIRDFVANAFDSIEPNSIFITSGDIMTGSAWYFQSTNQRPDVVVISADMIVYDWYVKNAAKRYPDVVSMKLLEIQRGGDRLLAIFKDNISYRKIYSLPNSISGENADDFKLIPIGIVSRVIVSEADEKEILASGREWENYMLRGIKVGFYKNEMVDNITKYYVWALNNTGMAYFRNGFFEEAEYLIRKALDIGYDSRIETNLKQVLSKEY